VTNELKFFKKETRKITAEEAERLDSPEAIGHELVLNVKGWIVKALTVLEGHPGIMPTVDMTPPDWLDLSVPDHAIHELQRVCRQLPRYMPPASTQDQLNQDEQNAVEVIYRIRQLHDTLVGLGVPASSAVVLIKAGLLMGVSVSHAHVDPWEPLAVSGLKSKKGGSKGGEKEKRRKWAEWACDRAGGWDNLPVSANPWEFVVNDMTVYEIYRDGDSLIAVDIDAGKEHKLARSTIEKRYL